VKYLEEHTSSEHPGTTTTNGEDKGKPINYVDEVSRNIRLPMSIPRNDVERPKLFMWGYPYAGPGEARSEKCQMEHPGCISLGMTSLVTLYIY
jgi:hypothetical protein